VAAVRPLLIRMEHRNGDILDSRRPRTPTSASASNVITMAERLLRTLGGNDTLRPVWWIDSRSYQFCISGLVR
jgi:hypothetical protein